MPISQYDPEFGGKKGAAAKAKRAMEKTYGEEEGERVFYATKNQRKSKRRKKRSSRR